MQHLTRTNLANIAELNCHEFGATTNLLTPLRMPDPKPPLVLQNEFEHEATPYRWFCAVLKQMLGDDPVARRPGYIWGLLQAAHLAQNIGVERISAIEFGVAGGNGLVALERIAARLEPLFGVEIDVYGFDTGGGLPKPTDYRDVPNLHAEGNYEMDCVALSARLRKAKLVIGPISETLPSFIASAPAVVGFVAVDVDYYSSTVATLALFAADARRLLPRVFCFFDDILGFTHSEFTGELLAIREFNERHALRKISPIPGLRYYLDGGMRTDAWPEHMFIAHSFEHPLYGRDDGMIRVRRLPLAGEGALEVAAKQRDETQRARVIAAALRRAERRAAGDRVVIFGASLAGERGLSAMPDGRKAVAFCDNDTGKHGTMFCGLPVIAPAALAQTPHEWVLIAAGAYREIFLQLAALGEPLDRLEILAHGVRIGAREVQGREPTSS